MPDIRKRETAYKIRIGELLKSNRIFDQSSSGNLDHSVNPRLLHAELGNKKIVRVNIIANLIDKFESEGERRFASITLDDGSGQIKARVFGEDVKKFKEFMHGDTILVIGLLRSFNQELYILPEIIKKQDPKYLLIRKLEIEKSSPKLLTPEQKKEIKSFRDDLIEIIKSSEKTQGIEKDDIIIKFKEAKPEVINQEIQKLLEDGIIYETRPGRVRYLG